eukprot:2219000-Ditylum_brightwellii.AAC.1
MGLTMTTHLRGFPSLPCGDEHTIGKLVTSRTDLVRAYEGPGNLCQNDEAHVKVDLIVSELSNGSRWSITDDKGI